MKRLLPILAFAAFTILSAFTLPGDDASIPSITVRDLDNKAVDIQEYVGKGKPVVVSFWATWCGPCKKELDNMNLLIQDWVEDYGVEVVAVSIDDARNSLKVKPYTQSKKWEFQVLLDVNGDSKRALNFDNIPYTVLVDGDGKIVYKHLGYTEGDEYILEDNLKELAGK